MNAIVTRCREMRTLVSAAPVRYGMAAVRQCEIAADEIERLLAVPKPRHDPHSVPTEPGFYWARWILAEDGTDDDGDCCMGSKAVWEVVEVWLLTGGNGAMTVSVPGVAVSQGLDCFFWGPGPLRAPERQS